MLLLLLILFLHFHNSICCIDIFKRVVSRLSVAFVKYHLIYGCIQSRFQVYFGSFHTIHSVTFKEFLEKQYLIYFLSERDMILLLV